MKDKFLCVMAQYDSKTDMRLNELQKILEDYGFYGKQTKNLRHHITLGYFDVIKEDNIRNRIKEVATQCESFEVGLNSIGLFNLDVLYISPIVNNELIHLQQCFHQDCLDQLSWVAHTTMLIDESERIEQAAPILSKYFTSFIARIESISLYEFFPAKFIVEENLLR